LNSIAQVAIVETARPFVLCAVPPSLLDVHGTGIRTSLLVEKKSDFTADSRLLVMSAFAVPTGLICAAVALVLQQLIGFFTNLFYHFSLALPNESTSPADHQLGWWSVLIPVGGGLIIGLMARYGSERIRGHGIPEALEAILIGKSRMQPKVAVLKPLSSAISIGSGGPFGAEGPIIMTGGAFGSIIAQIFNLTASERKTLLVAGAAGGMAATFGTPIAATLLAVEMLLFEWKPRSLIPVAIASVVATAGRPLLHMRSLPLFPVTLHDGTLSMITLGSAAVVGLFAGLVALALTLAVYKAEDLFQRLPFHWMWWPALGGLAIGLGGMIEPRALGVGYDVINDFISGHYTLTFVITLVLVKATIWAIALGSGTSGGVLAPLLMMGGAVGALSAGVLPGGDGSLWPLVGMAAVMGGTMRAPLTGSLFALELTYDIRALPSILLACIVADAFTVLVMKRSILTEKVARRGYHVSREYSVDPLERLSIADVMSKEVVVIPARLSVSEIVSKYFFSHGAGKHQGYPVVDEQGTVLGIITKTNLLSDWVISHIESHGSPEPRPIIAYDLVARDPVTAFAWESCRTAAERMAKEGVGRLVVVSEEKPTRLLGIVTRSDLLKPRSDTVEEENKRERFLLVSSQS